VSETAEHPGHRLLTVAYWYPPAVGAAAERAWAFARYLPEHSWQCHVLTARRSSPAPSAPGVVVREVGDCLSGGDAPFRDYDPRQRPSRVRACLRELVFPDRFVCWQRSAVELGSELIGRHGIDVVLASFPPASAVNLGLRLSRDSGVPLVLDFRDRWLGPGGYEPVFGRTRRRHAELERAAVARSKMIIAVSDAMADAIAQEQNYDRSRIVVIPNGYEPATDDLESAGASPTVPPPPSGLTIAHVGTVIPRNRPDLFFQSITKLLAGERLRDVMFRFVGNLSRDYLDAAGLGRVVQTTGLVSRSQAMGEMHTANALLLLTGRYVGAWGYNAKLFEYIRARRPILCLEESPGSNDRKLLEQFAGERSFFAPLDDPDAIGRAVEAVRQHLAAPRPPATLAEDAFAAYSRPNLVARLAGCLDGLFGR
jgi:glycosyltransferase involved in cell wall biosynthesis